MPRKQRNKSCQAESNMCSKKPEIKSRNKKPMGSNKNCQADKNSVMWSVTKEENTDLRVPKPAIKSICRDKNCQSTRCYRSPRRPKCDKNCQ